MHCNTLQYTATHEFADTVMFTCTCVLCTYQLDANGRRSTHICSLCDLPIHTCIHRIYTVYMHTHLYRIYTVCMYTHGIHTVRLLIVYTQASHCIHLVNTLLGFPMWTHCIQTVGILETYLYTLQSICPPLRSETHTQSWFWRLQGNDPNSQRSINSSKSRFSSSHTY